VILSQSLSYVYIFPILYMFSTLCLLLWCITVVLFNTVLYNKEHWEAFCRKHTATLLFIFMH